MGAKLQSLVDVAGKLALQTVLSGVASATPAVAEQRHRHARVVISLIVSIVEPMAQHILKLEFRPLLTVEKNLVNTGTTEIAGCRVCVGSHRRHKLAVIALIKGVDGRRCAESERSANLPRVSRLNCLFLLCRDAKRHDKAHYIYEYPFHVAKIVQGE